MLMWPSVEAMLTIPPEAEKGDSGYVQNLLAQNFAAREVLNAVTYQQQLADHYAGLAQTLLSLQMQGVPAPAVFAELQAPAGFQLQEPQAPAGFQLQEPQAPAGFQLQAPQAPAGFQLQEPQAPAGFQLHHAIFADLEESPAPQLKHAGRNTWSISNLPAHWDFPELMRTLASVGLEERLHYDCLCMPKPPKKSQRRFAFVNTTSIEAGRRLMESINGLAVDEAADNVSSAKAADKVQPPLAAARARRQGLTFYVEHHPQESRFFCGAASDASDVRTAPSDQQFSPQPSQSPPAVADVSTEEISDADRQQDSTTDSSPVATSSVDTLNLLTRLMEDDADTEKAKPEEVPQEMPEASRSACPIVSLADLIDQSVYDVNYASTPPPANIEIDSEAQAAEAALAASMVVQTTVIVNGLEKTMDTTEFLRILAEQLGLMGGLHFDFLYLPLNCNTLLNLGYAIVNLRDPWLAAAIVAKEEGLRTGPNYEKKSLFKWAHTQGEANRSRFLKRHGHLRNDKMRPLVWDLPYISPPQTLKCEKEKDVAKAVKCEASIALDSIIGS